MAKKHDEGRAAETLSYLRNLPQEHPYVQDELAGIMNQVENERQLTAGADRFQVVRETFGPNNRIRLLKGVILMIFFQVRSRPIFPRLRPSSLTSLRSIVERHKRDQLLLAQDLRDSRLQGHLGQTLRHRRLRHRQDRRDHHLDALLHRPIRSRVDAALRWRHHGRCVRLTCHPPRPSSEPPHPHDLSSSSDP